MIRNIFHIIFSPSFYMFCDLRFEKIQFDFLFQKLRVLSIRRDCIVMEKWRKTIET